MPRSSQSADWWEVLLKRFIATSKETAHYGQQSMTPLRCLVGFFTFLYFGSNGNIFFYTSPLFYSRQLCVSVCTIDQVGSVIYTGDCMPNCFFSVHSLTKFYKLFRLFFLCFFLPWSVWLYLKTLVKIIHQEWQVRSRKIKLSGICLINWVMV